jgi:hypothetical protein
MVVVVPSVSLALQAYVEAMQAAGTIWSSVQQANSSTGTECTSRAINKYAELAFLL